MPMQQDLVPLKICNKINNSKRTCNMAMEERQNERKARRKEENTQISSNENAEAPVTEA